MNSFLLWIVTAGKSLWKRMGVDSQQLYAIIDAKLKMDNRRKPPMYTGHKGDENESSHQGRVILVNFLFGLLMTYLIFQYSHKPTGLTFYFAAWMVFLSMILIVDFSDVLLDTKDNYIIFPRPINDITISIARILHIIFYLFRQVAAFILPAIIFILFSNRLGLGVFLIQCILVVILTVFLVNALYLLVMKYSSPERFNNIINNLQIVFIMVVCGSSYFLPNMMGQSHAIEANIFNFSFSYLLPPAWIAALWELLINGNFSVKILIHILLAFVGTGGAFIFVSMYLSRDFNSRLLSISQAKDNSKSSKKVKTEKSNNWINWLANMVTYTKVENATFKFTLKYIKRDRIYRLKTYPILGYIPIIAFGMFQGSNGDFAERISQFQGGSHYLVLIYICAFMAVVPLGNAIYSDKSGQSWIFRVTPVAHPQYIFKGMAKAIFIQFLFPMWIVMIILSVSLWGPKVVDDFLLGGLILIGLGLIVCRRNFKYLPFSRPWSEKESGSFIWQMLSIYFGIGVIAWLHYWFLDQPIVLLGGALVAILVNVITWRSFSNFNWDKIIS